MAQPPPYPSAPPMPSTTPQGPSQPMVYPSLQAGPPPPSGPPPPYTPALHKGQAQPGHTTVVVQQTPVVHHQTRQNRGFLSSLMGEVDKVGHQLGKGVDYCGKKLNQAVDQNISSSLLDLFCHGNVVQLIPKSTGRTVQILLNQQGHMILDGNGLLDPNAVNALWTVVNEGKNQIRLHNNNNYIGIINNCTTVVPVMPGMTLGKETKFQLGQMSPQYVTLESMADEEKFVAFHPTGQIKLPIRRDLTCQFAVKLVSTAYPVVPQSLRK